jgi:ribosome-associated protein
LVDALLEKKGSDILLLDVRDQAIFADYFLLCTGDTEPQLRALSHSVMGNAKSKAGARARGVEGEPADGWILVDYGDVIVHLFDPAKRAYYDLESLWHEARIVVRMQ